MLVVTTDNTVIFVDSVVDWSRSFFVVSGTPGVGTTNVLNITQMLQNGCFDNNKHVS